MTALLVAPMLGGRRALDAIAQAAPSELLALTIAQIYERIARRSISPVELTNAYLQRIERLNPTLNAYVTVTAERAREDARKATAVLAGAARPGPLHGVPIAHKDLFETAGIRTTAGSRLYDKHVPARDSAIVARLAAAGAVLLGKTNTHELGGGVTTINTFFGTTHNPWDAARVAGGSSGGSAAAVAAQLAVAATGSDTGGSIRIPAAFCGCVGFKPTFGRIATAGLLGASPTFDHAGVLTRTVEDAALMYEACTGDKSIPDGASTRPPAARGTITIPPATAPLRIGVPRKYFFADLQPDVAAALEEAIKTFRQLRAEVRDVDLPIDDQTMTRVFDPIIVAEIWATLGREWKERPDAFSKSFAGFFVSTPPSAAELTTARAALRTFQQQVEEAFARIDVLLMPTVPTTAPPIAGPINGLAILRNTWPFNAARTPAISIPCGVDRQGLPIGLQLVAKVDEDVTLLRAGHAYERATGWHKRRP